MSSRLTDYCGAKHCVLCVIYLSFILLIFGDSSLCTTVALAESIEAGVKPGDWIEYELNWTITPPPPYSLKIRREILAVDGSNLTMKIVQEMDNGSIQDSTKTGDFIEGTGAADIIFITPDLGPGDFVKSQGFGVIFINGTDHRAYVGTERTVLWSSFSQRGFDLLVFWDKDTGVALEIHILHSSRAGVTKIVACNLWDSGSGDDDNDGYGLLGLGIPLLIIAAVTMILLLWRRHVSSKK